MQYDVIVRADISRSISQLPTIEMPAQLSAIVSELLADKTKLLSEGVLRSEKGGRIALCFKGDNRKNIKISFSKKDASLVALEGDDTLGMPAVFFLEQGVRHRSVCKAPDGSKIEFTVLTHKLDNNLLRSGRMTIDYSVDICGVRAESTHISLSVTHAEA